MSTPAPIALFVYNRPRHLQRTLETLQTNSLAEESDLWVFSDGARSREHEASVAAVRELVRSIQGFKSLTVVERETNYGLSRSIVSGVNTLCESYGSVIVVEDDLVLAPGFLSFVNRGLERYATDERIMQISGFQFGVNEISAGECCFLPLINCWGWGTWARAWRAFDPNEAERTHLAIDKPLRDRFNLFGAYDYFSLLQKQVRGQVDSWGIIWYLNVFNRDGLVLFPPRSLVSNTGFDGSGDHRVDEVNNIGRVSECWPDAETFRLPVKIATSLAALEDVKRVLRENASPSLIHRFMKRLGA